MRLNLGSILIVLILLSVNYGCGKVKSTTRSSNLTAGCNYCLAKDSDLVKKLDECNTLNKQHKKQCDKIWQRIRETQ